jgi:hypothetical protein
MSQPLKIYAYPVAEGLCYKEEYTEAHRRFTHPGIFSTIENAKTVRERVSAGETAWLDSLSALEEWAKDALRQEPEPVQRIFRRTPNHIGTEESTRDFRNASQLCWLYLLTDKTEYADKAVEIIDAWSGTLKAIRGAGFNLQSGLMIPTLIDAAEVLKYCSDRWSEDSQARFKGFCEVVLLPHVLNLRISINGNHDCATNNALLALAIHLDDEYLFNRSLNYYLYSKGYGSIAHYFLPNGECQEDGRDLGHVTGGIHFFSVIARIAANQGENLYDRFDYRLAAAMEHAARAQLDYESPAMYSPAHAMPVRYRPRGWSGMSVEDVLAYQHYSTSRGMPMPFMSHLLRTASEIIDDANSPTRHQQIFLPDAIVVPDTPQAPAVISDAYNVGVIPFDAGPIDDATYDLLASETSRSTGKQARIIYVENPQLLVDAVQDGTLDAALIPSDEYVSHRESHDLALVASERIPDGRAGYHHLWLAPAAAGVSTPKEAFESDAVLAAVFPFALPTCIDLIPYIDAGYTIPEIFARIRFDQTNGNYAYKIADLFKTLWSAGDGSDQLAIVATTDIDINASKLPLSKLTRSAHTFPFVEKYTADWQKVFPYYTPFFAEALGFSVNLHDQNPKHYLDYEDQLVTVWQSPEIPGQAFVTKKGNEIRITCPPNYQTTDEWNKRPRFPGLVETLDSRYDIIRRAVAVKSDLFAHHTETELRVGGGSVKGKPTERGMPETIYHDLRFGGNLVKPSDHWDCSPGGWLRTMMRVE